MTVNAMHLLTSASCEATVSICFSMMGVFTGLLGMSFVNVDPCTSLQRTKCLIKHNKMQCSKLMECVPLSISAVAVVQQRHRLAC